MSSIDQTVVLAEENDRLLDEIERLKRVSEQDYQSGWKQGFEKSQQEIERMQERLRGSDMLAHVRGEQIERLLARMAADDASDQQASELIVRLNADIAELLALLDECQPYVEAAIVPYGLTAGMAQGLGGRIRRVIAKATPFSE